MNDTRSKGRVLVVEDDFIIAADLEKCLAGFGWTVCGRAADYETAVAAAERLEPDLIFMDIVLEGERDGIEAARAIREKSMVPVVFMTAHSDASRIERAKLTFPYGYLLKPYQSEAVKVTAELALFLAREERLRRQAEAALMESESKYRQLYHHAPTGIYEIDLEHNRLLDVNDVACEYLGYTRDELLSLNPLDLLAPASRFLFRERLNRYMEGESVPSQVEAELLAKDGTRVWVLLSANFRGERGRIVGASVVAQDISQRKMMENAARKNEERFRLIANHSVDAAFFHDRRLRYTWITKTFGSFSLEEILGNDDLALWGQEGGGAVYEFKRAVLTQKTRMRSEFALPLADGQSAHFEITCNPRTDFDGQVIGLSGFMRDVTERRRAEEEIRKREEQLREEQKNLEEANAAFKLLLKHRDDEKQNHQEELFKNIKNLIAPYLERLKNTNLDRSQRDLVEIVEQNLAAILPGFTAQEFDLLENLTPRELEVVNMIKLGYGNKKISDLMNVSEQTVSFHRKNIRKKLGLTHGGRNLRSHLLRLSR